MPHTHMHTHTHTGSENLWVLRNLTDPISLGGESTHKDKLDDFGSTKSANKSQLFSFTRPLIRTSTNFTSIFNTASENDYTHHMWNGDVTLIIFVSNLTNPMTFKVGSSQEVQNSCSHVVCGSFRLRRWNSLQTI